MVWHTEYRETVPKPKCNGRRIHAQIFVSSHHGVESQKSKGLHPCCKPLTAPACSAQADPRTHLEPTGKKIGGGIWDFLLAPWQEMTSKGKAFHCTGAHCRYPQPLGEEEGSFFLLNGRTKDLLNIEQDLPVVSGSFPPVASVQMHVCC